MNKCSVDDISGYLHKHPAGVKIITRSLKKHFDSTDDYRGVLGIGIDNRNGSTMVAVKWSLFVKIIYMYYVCRDYI